MSKKDMKKKVQIKPNPTPKAPTAVQKPKPAETPALPAVQSAKKPSERQLIRQAQQDEIRQRRNRRLIMIAVGIVLVGAVVLSIIFGSRQPTINASLQQAGSLDCFPAGLVDEQGAPVDCRVTAALFDGANLNLATSSQIPGDGFASIFQVPFAESKPSSESFSYLTADFILKAVGFESMAISSDGEYIFASTGFDRVKIDSDEWNYYNMLLAWPTGDANKVQVVSATTTTEGITSSVSMRNKFSQLLDGAAYFKVGGLTAIPGNYLIFGLTDIGTSAEDNQAVIKLITIPYSIDAETGVINLSDRYEVKYSLEPAKSNPEIPHRLSLSSLEYDPYKHRLLILASYDEGENGSGAYLWKLSIQDMNNSSLATLVTNEDGTPFELSGSPQGLTVIGENTFLVTNNAADRSPQQATYQIITLNR